MRIVCGTDFSSPARQAATVAALLSAKSGGGLHLLHGSGPRGRGDPALDHEELAREVGRLRAMGAVLTAGELVSGDPDEVLVQAAARVAADLVVIGATGHRLAERMFLGSVAVRTARDSPVPILVVRGAEPFTAWLGATRPLRVIVGFDPGESALNALRWAADLQKLGSVDLTVVEAVVPGIENRRIQASGPGVGFELRPEAEAQLLETLRHAVASVTGDLPARLMVKPGLGRTDIHLAQAAESVQADLVVVGSHQRKGFQRWWHGSVSSGVLHAASTSVAVVPYRPAAG